MKKIIFILSVIMMMLGNFVLGQQTPDSTKMDTLYRKGLSREMDLCVFIMVNTTEFYKPDTSFMLIEGHIVPIVGRLKLNYLQEKPYVKLTPGLIDISQPEINSLFSGDSIRRIIRKPQFNLWYGYVGENIFFLKEKAGNHLTDLKYEIKKKHGRNSLFPVVSHIVFFFFILYLYWFILSLWDKYYITWGFFCMGVNNDTNGFIYRSH